MEKNGRYESIVYPNNNFAAIIHIVIPMMISKTRQADGLAKSGLNNDAPYPRLKKNMSEANVAPKPKAIF